MKLAIFVHEFTLEIGHSHATIELIRNLPENTISEIVIFAYDCDDLDSLFPKLKCKKTWIKPIIKLKFPFLFKDIFFQFNSFYYAWKLKKEKFLRLSIGLATIFSDIINIQFVHSQWMNDYLSILGKNKLVYAYKFILYKYFHFLEYLVYSNKKIKIFCLAEFISKYIRDKYGRWPEDVVTIYSGVNLEKFSLSKNSRFDLYKKLCLEYPALVNIDLSRPVFLFVGALERKGISLALEIIKKNNYQIIVIGRGEKFSQYEFPRDVKMAYISFTKNLPEFYSLADAFIFPTQYEPFGLVIIEATAMGLPVFIPKKNVGAAEILVDLPEVYISDNFSQLPFNEINIKSFEDRNNLRNVRLPKLEKYNWVLSSEKLDSFIKSLVS